MLIDDMLNEPIIQRRSKEIGLSDNLMGLLRVAQRFDFSDVRPFFEDDQEYDGNGGGINWSILEKAFACIPPYPVTWCEFAGRNRNLKYRFGCLFLSMDMPQLSTDIVLRSFCDKRSHTEQSTINPIFNNALREPYIENAYMVGYASFLLMEDRVLLSHVPGMMYFADQQGRPITVHRDIPSESNLQTVLDLEDNFLRPATDKECRVTIEDAIFFQYCFNLLACKNVEIAEKSIDKKLQKARIRRGKKPLLSMYTLKINMPKTGTLKKEQRDPNNETVMKRFHTVRGHFAHYTEEKPLFGRHVGRFFVPAHTRGSKDLGEIRKDYKGVAK